MPRIKVHVDKKLLTKELAERTRTALMLTGNDVISDVLEAQVVPKMRGTLESTLQPLDVSELNKFRVKVHSNTPYARRLYYHPEYHFHRAPWSIVHKDGTVEHFEGNPNARGLWFEPWIDGDRSEFVRQSFAYYMRTKR